MEAEDEAVSAARPARAAAKDGPAWERAPQAGRGLCGFCGEASPTGRPVAVLRGAMSGGGWGARERLVRRAEGQARTGACAQRSGLAAPNPGLLPRGGGESRGRRTHRLRLRVGSAAFPRGSRVMACGKRASGHGSGRSHFMGKPDMRGVRTPAAAAKSICSGREFELQSQLRVRLCRSRLTAWSALAMDGEVASPSAMVRACDKSERVVSGGGGGRGGANAAKFETCHQLTAAALHPAPGFCGPRPRSLA